MTTRVQFYATGAGALRCRITYTAPAPGAIIRAIGRVTIVHRDPGKRAGYAWAAPYAVNCAAHGWIASRASTDQASAEAYAHLATAHRAPVLACPICGNRDLTRPRDNGHAVGTECQPCRASMTVEAATPGTRAHEYIRANSRDRAA